MITDLLRILNPETPVPTLVIMKLILQDLLQINSLVFPYSSTFTKITFPWTTWRIQLTTLHLFWYF